MTRLLALVAVSLALVACGSGAKHALAPANASATRPAVSVKAVATARERQAGHEADELLARLVLPPGARPARLPRALTHPNLGVSVLTEFAYRHRVWRMREPLPEAVRFLRRHEPPGFEFGVSGGTPYSLGFDLPPVHGWPMQRILDLEFVARRGWTFVRADAGAAWIYPRSPREVVPSGVREIDVHGAGVDRHVTAAADVARIVRWFDALPVTPPGHTVIGCAANLSTSVRFVFRSASGAKLASAVVPSEPADGCDPVELTIGGKEQTPLIDANFRRGAFVNRVQRLLGVCFRDPRRACR